MPTTPSISCIFCHQHSCRWMSRKRRSSSPPSTLRQRTTGRKKRKQKQKHGQERRGDNVLQTGIQLQDNFSSVLNGIMDSVNLAVSAMYDMQQAMSTDVEMPSLDAVRDSVNQTTAALEELNNAMQNPTSNPAAPRIAPPEPAAVPAAWETDGLEVFTGSGTERFRQEILSANSMMERLCSTQDRLARQALHMDILPPGAFQDMNSLAVRMDSIRDRIQQIENDPVNLGTDTANAELEQLRTRLSLAVQQQEELNRAMQSMDISAANSAYLRLSQIIGGTEQHIRDSADEQGQLNQLIRDGTSEADSLLDTVKRIAAAYVTLQGAASVLDFSDMLAQTTSRLNLMNDGVQTTSELFDMIYSSARGVHAPVMETADAIAKMGNNAGAAFASSEELVDFMEQVNKQFIIGGASAEEQSNALLQLSQAMAAGALRGEELNSILEAAPGIARTIEENMGWAEGSIKSYAEEGAVTAEVVKTSLLEMADETNEAFESMPMTFSQVMTDIQDDAVMAFQPLAQQLNEIANSTAFQNLVDTAVQAMSALANSGALDVFISRIDQFLNTLDGSGTFQEFMNGAVVAFEVLLYIMSGVIELASMGSSIIIDNWSWISPIIYGVAGALAVYYGWQMAANMVSAISKGIHIAMAVAQMAHAAATGTLTAATAADIAAQYGLNAAMYACPLVWIVMLVIALVAALYAAVAAVNHFAGTSVSATGIICGVLAVAAAFIWNQIAAVINFVIDCFCVLWNFIAAFANFFANVFTDPVGAIARLFFDLADCVLGILESLASAIDTVFGSNLAGAVSGWRNSLGSWVDDTFGKGEEVMETMNGSDHHVQTFDYGDAWDFGYDMGQGIEDKVSGLFNPGDVPGIDKYNQQPQNYGGGGGGIEDGISNGVDNSGAAGNIEDIKDSVSVGEEELKYLRDLAEQETVNRYTVAEIRIDQTNNNSISSKMDLDGVVTALTDAVHEAAEIVTEGVHA